MSTTVPTTAVDNASEYGYDKVDPQSRAPPRQSGTDLAAANQKKRLAVAAPAARIKLAAFRQVAPLGIKVNYSENKVSIMPKLEDAVEEIASAMGIDMSDEQEKTLFLYALVTDVYTNPYSDKFTFEGDILVSDKGYPRRHIRDVLQPRVGTHFRRYARALAPTVVALIRDNSDFDSMVDKRALELNISRADAYYSFDGADVLTDVNRDTNARNAAARVLALAKRDTGAEYRVSASSAAVGSHSFGNKSSGVGSESVGFTQSLD